MNEKLVEQTLDYIECNIHNKVSLDDIAEALNISKFHLHRVFRQAIDRPLMDYIRARKLSHSIDPLMLTSKRTQDISIDYGFDHIQSYIRAFKKEFGITPGKFKKEETKIALTEKFDKGKRLQLDQGILLPPVYVAVPKFQFMGHHHKVYFEDDLNNDTLNKINTDFYHHHRSKIKALVHNNVQVGIIRFRRNKFTKHRKPQKYFTYIAAAEVNTTKFLPHDMIVYTMPYHKYAIFKYIGHHKSNQITQSTRYQILKHHATYTYPPGYSRINYFLFEMVDMNISNDTYCEIDIYIPIRRINDTSTIERTVK